MKLISTGILSVCHNGVVFFYYNNVGCPHNALILPTQPPAFSSLFQQ